MRRLAAWVLVVAIPGLAHAQIVSGSNDAGSSDAGSNTAASVAAGSIAAGSITAGTAPVNDGSTGMNTYDDQLPDDVFHLAPIGLDRTVDPSNIPGQIGGFPAQDTAAAHDDALGQVAGNPGGMNTGINSPRGNAQ